jgi:MoxR-like ATPase
VSKNNQKAIQPKIRKLLEQLSLDLFEREEVVRLSLLSAIAGESIFLLGPPGVAKSMVARRLKYAFEGANSFEYLMGKFSTPDEIFGPVSISKLRNEDKYERLVDNYLPGAQIVFLDEIWKASPPIQNALLTVLNEKIYRNGDQELKVDLRGLIAASNELPQRGEGLEALWDRFLLRLIVGGIEDKELFNAMITLSGGSAHGDYVDPELKVSDETYLQWNKDIDYIFVPPHVLGLIGHLRTSLTERNNDRDPHEQLYISDRRWRKIVRLMRSSAYLNGRKEIDLMDCFLINYCIWNQIEEVEEVQKLVEDTVVKHGYRALYDLTPVLKMLNELQEDIQTETQVITKEKVEEKIIHQDENKQQYFGLPLFWGEDTAYLRIEDYDRLSKEKEVFVPVFEKSYEKYRPFQSYSFIKLNSKTLLNKTKKYQLETQLGEKEIVTAKAPSKELIKSWNNAVKDMLAHCNTAIQILREREEIDLGHLRRHLFIGREKAPFVQESLKNASQEVLNLKLEIEKVQHGYQSMGKGG